MNKILDKRTEKIIKKSYRFLWSFFYLFMGKKKSTVSKDLFTAGAGGVIALAVYLFIQKITFNKNIKLAVLGREQAGKTSFWNFLKDEKPGNPDQTPPEEKIGEFTTKDSEGHTITISSVIDISGQWDYVAKYYKKLVEENDVILFFFNSKDFMTDEEYSTDVVDRIIVMANHINSTKDSNNKSVYIVPTFKDVAEANGITDILLQKKLFHKLNEDPVAEHYANSSNILPMYQTNDIDSLTDLRDRIFASFRQNS